jgi:hypothetical protein
LLEVAEARSLSRLFPTLSQNGQQQPGKGSNDCYDNQQLDKGETAFHFHHR